MRGQEKNIKTLSISGRVFIEFKDKDIIAYAQKGDVYLYLFLDSIHSNPQIAHNSKGYKGYIKTKVFDGSKWCHLNSADFFEEKENYFSKHEISKNVLLLCKEVIEEYSGTEIYRTYRNHYTSQKYEQDVFKGKKGHFNLSKPK